VLEKDEKKQFEDFQLKSIEQTKKMIEKNGAKVFNSLSDVANFLNNQEHKDKIKKLSGL
jgi:hypothetical protein